MAGKTLTRHQRGSVSQTYVSWYLFPIMEWFGRNWVELLHEEDFAWPETSAQSAAAASSRAMAQWMASDDDQSRAFYKNAQEWRSRHALRSVANGGLLPDVVFRRYLDTIEVSWTSQEPRYAGEGFAFTEDPGVAHLLVEDVAKPLWDVLTWVAGSASVKQPLDVAAVKELQALMAKLEAAPSEVFENAYAPSNVLSFARARLKERSAVALQDIRVDNAPAIQKFSPAVAMFGGVSPDLREADIDALSFLLASACEGQEPEVLTALVDDVGPPPSRAPYLPGQQLALELIDELDWDLASGWVDIRAIVARLGIHIEEVALDTDSIRGVALAGDGLRPTILVNLTSFYNTSEEGKRFTIAHELCHILYDRSFARRVAVTSGQWAPPGVEKRANAFAAMLLMPSSLVASTLGADFSLRAIGTAARALHVSQHSLIEHLYNVRRIGETERDRLRSARLN